MINKSNTTSVLNTLEEYRKKLSQRAFRSLILSLTTELNIPTWIEKVLEQNLRAVRQNCFSEKFQQQIPSKTDIDDCILIILYYIVSVFQVLYGKIH